MIDPWLIDDRELSEPLYGPKADRPADVIALGDFEGHPFRGNQHTGGGVPPEPGTTPIPEGKIRGYHYTRNLEAVKQEGLQFSKAEGSTYGEPNAIWFSTEKPGDFKDYVEVFLDPDEVIQSPLDRREDKTTKGSLAKVAEFNKGNHDFMVNADAIPPDRFVTTHEPWHDRYRYFTRPENEKIREGVLAGKFDWLLDHPVDGPAIKAFKAEHADKVKKLAERLAFMLDDAPKKDVKWQEAAHPRDDSGRFGEGSGAAPSVERTAAKESAPAKAPADKDTPGKGVSFQTSPAMHAALGHVIDQMPDEEKQSLKKGYQTAQDSGYKGNLDDFFAEQAALYRHADETDQRFQTWFSGDTLDKLKASVAIDAHIESVANSQKPRKGAPSAKEVIAAWDAKHPPKKKKPIAKGGGGGGGGGKAEKADTKAAPAPADAPAAAPGAPAATPAPAAPAAVSPAPAAPAAPPAAPAPAPAPVNPVMAGMSEAETSALAEGFAKAQKSGFTGSLDDYFVDQVALYQHAPEGDPRLGTWFYGNTLTKAQADPALWARVQAAVATQKTASLSYRDKLAVLLGDFEGHPFRGNQWTGGQGASAVERVSQGRGRPPVYRVKTVEAAVDQILAGHVVEVESVRQVNTLLTKLAAVAKDAEEKGKKAPNYDLCKVSVAGTNLFCVDRLRNAKYPSGVPRWDMPQMGGKAVPGSKADKLPKDEKGEVDGTAQFVEHLKDHGITTKNERVSAAKLKATQKELVGPNVASMMASETYDPALKTIFVSRDNYVVDGHHRWAATVGRDARDGRLGGTKMNIVRIDAPISEILPLANKWAKSFGIAPKKAGGHKKLSDDVANALALHMNGYREKLFLLGGSGSGNFGHAGRPGEVGGSSSEGSSGQSSARPFGSLTPRSITPLGEDDKGANGSYKVVAESERGSVEVMFKPDAEQQLMSFDGIEYGDGLPTDREVAAFKVDQALGFGLVPETEAVTKLVSVQVTDDRGAGSVQEWVQAKNGAMTPYAIWDKVDEKQWYQMGALDLLIGNKDRHAGNFLISDRGVLTAIDHGYAFLNLPLGASEDFEPDPFFSSGNHLHLRSDARPPKDSAVPESVRQAMADKIRNTDWDKTIGTTLKGNTLRAFKRRTAQVADAVEQGKLNDLWMGGPVLTPLKPAPREAPVVRQKSDTEPPF